MAGMDTDPADATNAARERADLQAESDARATRLLIRIGIVAIAVLLVWVIAVVASFGN